MNRIRPFCGGAAADGSAADGEVGVDPQLVTATTTAASRTRPGHAINALSVLETYLPGLASTSRLL